MNEISDWKVPKWPFLLANAVLIAVAGALIYRAAHPVSQTENLLATASVALGSLLGCLPFILEYRASKKLVEINALTTVAEQLQNLQKYAAQVSTATDQWSRVQDATKDSAEKTAAAAREIAERMSTEIREFNEFQLKLNDTEKNALRLEVEKLRRVEGEWLQVSARILDHIFALHNAAVRSGQPDLAEQIGQFQAACHDAARRVGLAAFVVAPGTPFDAERQRAHGVENPPADAVAAETLMPGLTFQGRLLRHALVRLGDAPASAAESSTVNPAQSSEPQASASAPEEQLTLGAE